MLKFKDQEIAYLASLTSVAYALSTLIDFCLWFWKFELAHVLDINRPLFMVIRSWISTWIRGINCLLFIVIRNCTK